MNKIKYYLNKYKILLSIVVAMLLLFVIFLINVDVNDTNSTELEDDIKLDQTVKKEVDTVKNKVFVDIKGYVVAPGVYELEEGSRVIDAINRAGGLLDNSNTEYLNLSKKLVDEMIIVIYSNDEIEKFKYEDKEVIYIKYECDCPDNINDACISNNDKVNTIEDIKEIDDLVSINNGSLEDLMSLSGIGESKAKEIIKYREEHGEFEKIEDIMNVSGIGESAYSKIKDNIKL